MTREMKITCNFCGKIKGPNNGWWVVFVIERACQKVVSKTFGIRHPDDDFADSGSESKDACGHQCVTQAVARFMDHGNLEERL
jgi:hypothetical protein